MNKLFALLPLFGLLFIAACEDDDDNGDDNTPPATANVLVTHASPDAPGVDLLVDDAVVNSSALTFPNNTGYLEVEAGTRNVKVNASGTSTTVIDADLDLMADNDYSVFAIDTLASISALVLEDDLTAPSAGNAHVRFVHLSPDAPAVDITVPGLTLFSNTAFGEATAFSPVPAGTYDVSVLVNATGDTALNVPGLTVDDGKIYTVWASGFAGGGTPALGAQVIVNN